MATSTRILRRKPSRRSRQSPEVSRRIVVASRIRRARLTWRVFHVEFCHWPRRLSTRWRNKLWRPRGGLASIQNSGTNEHQSGANSSIFSIIFGSALGSHPTVPCKHGTGIGYELACSARQSGPTVQRLSVNFLSCRSHSIGNCVRRSSSSRVAGCRPSRMVSMMVGECSVRRRMRPR